MAMRTYEFALILTEEAGKDDKKVKVLVEELLNKVKAKLTKIEVAGKQELAYKIKKQTKGVYCFCKIEIAPEAVKDLDKFTQHNESVLRYLLISAKGGQGRNHVEPIVK